MFVITTKLSKTKLAAAVTLLIGLVVLAAVLTAAKTGKAPEETALAGETNDDRVRFLAQYGWELNAEPIQTQTVKIPETDTEVFTRYNSLQISQGFDLTQYAGREAVRYVYEILNYPEASAPVYATVFVMDGQIIGGDVTNTAPEGKLHGFQMPE